MEIIQMHHNGNSNNNNKKAHIDTGKRLVATRFLSVQTLQTDCEVGTTGCAIDIYGTD